MVWYTRAQFPLEVYWYKVYVPPTNMSLLNVNITVSSECCVLKFIIYIPQNTGDNFKPNLMFCDVVHFIAILTPLWDLGCDSAHRPHSRQVTGRSGTLTWRESQWVNSVPPYVRKLHFMYEVIRTSGKYRWNIYRTSSKCHWSIYRTSRKRRGTLRIVHKVERSSPTVWVGPVIQPIPCRLHCSGNSHSWMIDSHPSRPPIPEIRLFQSLTLKLHCQGHGCGQRPMLYSRPSIYLICMFFFNSHQSDNNSQGTAISKFDLEKSKVNVMSEVKDQCHVVYPVSNRCTSFSFHVNRTNFSWDMSSNVWSWKSTSEILR